jgi:uncharacterized protein
MSTVSSGVTNVNFILESLVRKVRGVKHAIVVSADGLLMARSPGLDLPAAEQIASVTSGLVSIATAGGRMFGAGGLNQVLVEVDAGYLFFMSISNGSCLAVVADQTCDVEPAGYEMGMVAKRFGTVLTPALVAELRGSLAAS